MKRQLFNLAKQVGIDDIGITDGSPYTNVLPGAKTVIVYILSYFAGNQKGNISRYARGCDYHTIMREVAEPLCNLLNSNGYVTKQFSDASPLPERFLAARAGLGIIGKNQALIHAKFGSYVFIGCILTDWDADSKSNISPTSCLNCNKCITACPGGALTFDDFTPTKCVSQLTQQKGTLSESEVSIIKKSGYLWGCDVCQEVCPHNLNLPICKHTEFTQNLIYDLPDVSGLSNKEFLRAYPNNAFTWRGKQVIIRNTNL